MARYMFEDAPFIYRLKIEQGNSVSYHGPFSTSAPANAQKTRIENHRKRYPTAIPVILTVERTECIWTPLP